MKVVESVKFSSPLRPGEAFSIALRDDEPYIAFDCRHAGVRIASGRLAVERDESVR